MVSVKNRRQEQRSEVVDDFMKTSFFQTAKNICACENTETVTVHIRPRELNETKYQHNESDSEKPSH